MGFTAQLLEVALGDNGVKAPIGLRVIHDDASTEVLVLPIEIISSVMRRYATAVEIEGVAGWLTRVVEEFDAEELPTKVELSNRVRAFGEGWTTKKVFKMYVNDHYGI